MTSPTMTGVDEIVVDLTDVLVKTLRALGQAGHPDEANRLAARAWWILRDAHPREAERINGAMHFLSRLPAESGARPTEAPTPTEKP
ncbi:MAG: hypothetical protein ABIZ07_07695 [Dermatophilaceae bacterium]